MPFVSWKRRGRPIAAVLVIAAVALLAYSSRQAPRDAERKARGTEKKLIVTASFYPLAYFAGRIGGGKADVMNVTPAGIEPHDYEPTAQDAARMESSDVLVLNGGGLEAWGDSIKRNVDPSKTRVVTAGEGLVAARVEEPGKVMTDPHVWLSPPLAGKMVDAIASAMAGADPADAAYFGSNAAALKADLELLDEAYNNGLAHCSKKDIVTSHAAFGYLAATYGFRQEPIAGLSPDAEPSPRQLAEIAAFVKKNGIGYVFFESLASPKLSDTIAKETGAKTLALDPIEGLTSADLAAGKDYLSEMRNDLAVLRIALQCGN